MPIYKDVKLEKRTQNYLFDEQSKIDDCNTKIEEIFGNHRDENNIFVKKLTEFEKTKLVRKALEDIVRIKKDLYFETGVKL